MNNDILVIGIAGGTGSGKTTLMNNLIERFKGSVTVLRRNLWNAKHSRHLYSLQYHRLSELQISFRFWKRN